MYYFVPDYYDRFACSAERCKDNCCIGWEIMVDDVSWQKYQHLPAAWRERLCRCIADEPGNRHFILQQDRCPLLNADNRCELILAFGEEALCDICDEHPRFTFEYEGWMETGLGLCCEEAARLILQSKKPAGFLCSQSPDADLNSLPEKLQKALDHRWKLFALLQSRNEALRVRLQALLTVEEAGKMPDKAELSVFVAFLQDQEPLTPEWPAVLKKTQDFLRLPAEKQAEVYTTFEAQLGEGIIEYEQLAVYFLFRHYLNALWDHQPALKARFTAVSVLLIQTFAVAEFYFSSQLPDFARRLRLAQIFSKEVEYNDEALAGMQDLLALSAK